MKEKKYTLPEEESQMVSEPSPARLSTYGAQEPAVAYSFDRVGSHAETYNVTNALWTLIATQAREVQVSLKHRLDSLLTAHEDIKLYTIAELQARIDESEKEMECGDVIAGEDVHNAMRQYVNSLAV